MSEANLVRRAFLGVLAAAGSLMGLQRIFGEEPKVAKNTNAVGDAATEAKGHPLDAALGDCP